MNTAEVKIPFVFICVHRWFPQGNVRGGMTQRGEVTASVSQAR